MSIGLIGTKIGMTREFMETGQSVPVPVIKVEKGRVVQLLNKEKIKGFIENFCDSFWLYCPKRFTR